MMKRTRQPRKKERHLDQNGCRGSAQCLVGSGRILRCIGLYTDPDSSVDQADTRNTNRILKHR